MKGEKPLDPPSANARIKRREGGREGGRREEEGGRKKEEGGRKDRQTDRQTDR